MDEKELEPTPDKTESTTSDFSEELDKLIRSLSSSEEVEREDLSSPHLGALDEILAQRKEQRVDILNFAKRLTTVSLVFLLSLIFVQVIVRVIYDSTFEVVSAPVLQILAVAIFGQIIGVIYIITRSLWDDKNYMKYLNNHKK